MARIRNPMKVHRYTAEFKLKAVKLSQLGGIQVQDVAEALDIHPIMLTRWRKEAREGRLLVPIGMAIWLRSTDSFIGGLSIIGSSTGQPREIGTGWLYVILG